MPTRFDDALRRGQRRTAVGRGLRFGGTGLLIGASVGLVLLLVDRLSDATLSWWLMAAAPVAGLLLGGLVGLLRPTSGFETAVRLDQTLGLKDRLATAAALRAGIRGDRELAPLVERDAERVAERADVRAATPVTLTPVWISAAAMATVLAVAVPLLPEIAWARPEVKPLTEEQQAALVAEQQEISDAIETVVDDFDDTLIDDITEQELDALGALADQLRDDAVTPSELDDARAASAARLDELADRLADESVQSDETTEAIAERFSSLPEPDAPMTSEEFLESLRNGDYGNAADMLDEFLQDADSMSEAERTALADELRSLSDQINDAGAEATDTLEEQAEQLRQALRDHGLDEDDLRDFLESLPETTEDIEQQLREQNVDEEMIEKLARDLEALRNEQDVQNEASDAAESVADALEDAADDIEQPDPSADDTTAEDPADQEQTTGQRDVESTDGQSPGEQTQDSESTESKPGEQTGEQTQDPNAGNESTGSESRPGEQTGEQGEQTQDPNAGNETTGSESKPGEQTGEQGEQTQDPNADNETTGSESKPGEQTGEQGEQTQDPNADNETTGSESKPGEQTGEQGEQTQDPNAGDEPRGAQPRPGEQGEPAGSEPTPGEQQPPDGNQTTDGTTPSPGDQSGEDTPAQPQPGEASDDGSDGPPTRRRPSDAIRDLEDAQRRARDQQAASERIREAARRLGGDTPRHMPDNLPSDMQSRGGPEAGDAPGQDEMLETPPPRLETDETDPLDLRDADEETGDIIAEWLDDEATAPRNGATRTTSSRTGRARQAAERAVEDSTVHRRYHKLIKRYFDRLPNTIDRARDAGTTPPTDG